MKQVLLTIFFSVLSLSIMAQRMKKSDLSVKVSQPEKQKGMRSGILSDLIGYDEETGEIYTQRMSGSVVYMIPMGVKLHIHKKDARFQEIKSDKYKMKGLPYKRQILGTELYNDAIVVLTSMKGKDKARNLEITEINKKSLKKVSDKVLLTAKKSSKVGIDFNYLISKDRKRMVVFSQKYNKRSSKTEYIFTVLDENLKEIWNGEKTIEHSMDNFTVISSLLTNDGKIVMYGYEFNQKGSFFSVKTTQGKSKLLVIDEEGVEEVDFDLDGKYISDFDMVEKENGIVSLTGLYGEATKTSSGVSGAFWLDCDINSGEINDVQFEEFEKDFIIQTWSAKAKKKDKRKSKRKKKKKDSPQLYNYIIHDLIKTEDGGDIMCAEQYYMYVTSHTDSKGNVTYTYHYLYNDIIVIKRDGNGDVEWKKVLNKYQHTTNDNGILSSFQYILDSEDDKLHLIFNDNSDNYDKAKMAKLKRTTAHGFSKSSAKYCVSDFEIDIESGEFKRKLILSAEDLNNKFRLVPRDAIRLKEENKLIMKAGRKKQAMKVEIGL